MMRSKLLSKKATRALLEKRAFEWPKKLEETLVSNAPLPQSSKLEATGQKRIDNCLREVLQTVWTCQVTTKSDFARENADYIAMAASMGLITTRIMTAVFGRQWQVTAKGLHALEEHYGIKTAEDHSEDEQLAFAM
jgi:hypothetical protein